MLFTEKESGNQEIIKARKKNEAGFRHLVRMIVPYCLVLFLVTLLFRTVLMLNYVPSSSMEPTIMTGDILLSTRYDLDKIERYDIVVFTRDDQDVYYIKRVIGLPGETITVESGSVYADGVKLDSSYIKEEMNASGDGIYVVPEDSYFVMGDNRNDSWDSRFWGTVPKDDMIAKAKYILYPFSDAGSLR